MNKAVRSKDRTAFDDVLGRIANCPSLFDIFLAFPRRMLRAVRAMIALAREDGMMVIAGEGYVCINVLMDALCLLAAARLGGLRASPVRVLGSALAGTGLSMVVLACWGMAAGIYAVLPLAALMALLAFGLERVPRGMAMLMFTGLLAAAGAGYLHRLGLTAWASALASAPALWYGLRLLLRWRSRAGERADVRLLFESGGITLDGLVDSGNLLRDPITALPVVVAPFSALRPHLPRGMHCDQLQTMPRGFRLILVRTAGGSRLLMCFRPRALYIRRGSVWHAAEAVVAVSPSLHGRRALLPPSVIND